MKDLLSDQTLDKLRAMIYLFALLELGIFLMLRFFGSVHNDDVVAITSLFLKWSVNETLIKEFIQLVKILEKGIVRRNPFATPRLSSSKTKLGQLDNVNTYQESRLVGL